MQPSECCIFRIVIASGLGLLITAALLWHYSPIVAVLAAPLGGSTAALLALVVFEVARPYVSTEPLGVDPDSDYFVRKIGFL